MNSTSVSPLSRQNCSMCARRWAACGLDGFTTKNAMHLIVVAFDELLRQSLVAAGAKGGGRHGDDEDDDAGDDGYGDDGG